MLRSLKLSKIDELDPGAEPGASTTDTFGRVNIAISE